MAFLITLAFIALILLCGFMVLVILMQKASQGAGMGGAIGGGAAESAFGGEASNVLTKVTIYCAIIFFLGCLGLSLIILHRHSNPERPALLDQIGDIESAPAAGTETQESTVKEKLEGAAQDAKEKVQDVVDTAKEKTEEAVETVKEKTAEAVDATKEKIEEVKTTVEEKVEEAVEKVEGKVEGAKAESEKAADEAGQDVNAAKEATTE